MAWQQGQPGTRVVAHEREVLAGMVQDLFGYQLLQLGELGNDLAPRLAQRLNTGLISHCTRLDLDMSERLLLGTFPVLGGEMYHTAACPEARPQIASLQPGHFRVPYEDTYRSGDVQQVDVDLTGTVGQLTWVNLDAPVADRTQVPDAHGAQRRCRNHTAPVEIERRAEHRPGRHSPQAVALTSLREALSEQIDKPYGVGVGSKKRQLFAGLLRRH